MEMLMTHEFPTSDLQLAAFLALLGHQPVRVEGTGARKVFVFRDVPAEDQAGYYRPTSLVAADLFTSYRTLRTRVLGPKH
jgi:hypothetical protein